MKDQDFLRIARLFGLVDDEVGGRGLATPEPALEQTLRQFARGQVPRPEQGAIIADLLRRPELLGWFATCLKEVNRVNAEGLLDRDAASGEATGGDEEQNPYDVGAEDQGDDDEVVGHDGEAPQLVCATCNETFAMGGTPSAAKVYACRHCGAHNLAGTQLSSRQWQGMPLPRIPRDYRPAVVLDSLFLKDQNGRIYEFPRELVCAYKMSPSRLKTLGHLPFEGAWGHSPPDEDDEVGGRHMTPSPGGGASPGDWSFHRTWEYGCFFSVPANAYTLGYHRHPYGDERAVGASEADFA